MLLANAHALFPVAAWVEWVGITVVLRVRCANGQLLFSYAFRAKLTKQRLLCCRTSLSPASVASRWFIMIVSMPAGGGHGALILSAPLHCCWLTMNELRLGVARRLVWQNYTTWAHKVDLLQSLRDRTMTVVKLLRKRAMKHRVSRQLVCHSSYITHTHTHTHEHSGPRQSTCSYILYNIGLRGQSFSGRAAFECHPGSLVSLTKVNRHIYSVKNKGR